MPEVTLAPLRTDRLDDLVALHRRAFPDAAITAFGTEAVRRYYAWLMTGPHDAIVMGAWRDGRLIGFCAAGQFRGAMNGFLRRERGYLARHVLVHPRLLFSPLIRDRIRTALRITWRYSRVGGRAPVAPPSPSFGVLSIATDPDARGAGAGAMLMEEAEARARDEGHRRMTLTVHPDNAHAIAFYERRGWIRDPAQLPWAGAMVRELDR